MQVYCHRCGHEVQTESVYLERRVTTCRQCGTVLNITNQLVLPESAWPEPLLPQGLSITRQDDELIITRRWFSRHYIGFSFFALYWNAIILVMALNISLWLYVILPHAWIGLGFLYYILTGLFNSTTIRVNKDQLSVKHRPIPVFGNRTLLAHTLRQLYVKEYKDNRKYFYEIHAI